MAEESFHRFKRDNHLPFWIQPTPHISQTKTKTGTLCNCRPLFLPFWQFDFTAKEEMRAISGIVPHDVHRRYTAQGFVSRPPHSLVKYSQSRSAVYGGYSYRRNMLDVVGKPLARGAASILSLENMTSHIDGIPTELDAWGVYQGTAWQVAREDYTSDAKERQASLLHPSLGPSPVRFKLEACRRVYMPAYLFEYTLFGNKWEVFVSGVTGEAYGIASGNLKQDLETAAQAAYKLFPRIRFVGDPRLPGSILASLFRGVFRFVFSAPGLAVIGIAAVTWSMVRKVLQPLLMRHQTHQAWRETQQAEQEEQRRSGKGFTWQDEFQETAENFKQWQRQQQAREAKQGRKARKPEWDFNPDDPYSVLGIPRHADAREISGAFRREMLKWHPDSQHGKSQEEKDYALQRSQLISAAYQRLKKVNRK